MRALLIDVRPSTAPTQPAFKISGIDANGNVFAESLTYESVKKIALKPDAEPITALCRAIVTCEPCDYPSLINVEFKAGDPAHF